MDEISADYIVYCIMLDDYLEQNGINSSDDEEFFEKERDYFPSDWEINYSLEEKLKI